MLRSAFEGLAPTGSMCTARVLAMSRPTTTRTKAATTIRIRLANRCMSGYCNFGTTLPHGQDDEKKNAGSELDLGPQDVVEVDDAGGPPGLVDDDQARDRPAGLHDVERRG